MKDDAMKRARGIVSCFIFLSMIAVIPIESTSETPYGSVHAWFRTTDGVWENATAHPVLQRGETFEIRIQVTINTNLKVVYLKLHEYGTPVYEVIAGPTRMEQLLEQWKPSFQDHSWTYLWKMRVRPNTSWVNGYGPLEVYVQFNKNNTDESRVNFDVITAYIIDELSEQCITETNKSYSGEKPRRPMVTSTNMMMTILVIMITLFLRVKKQ